MWSNATPIVVHTFGLHFNRYPYTYVLPQFTWFYQGEGLMFMMAGLFGLTGKQGRAKLFWGPGLWDPLLYK